MEFEVGSRSYDFRELNAGRFLEIKSDLSRLYYVFHYTPVGDRNLRGLLEVKVEYFTHRKSDGKWEKKVLHYERNLGVVNARLPDEIGVTEGEIED